MDRDQAINIVIKIGGLVQFLTENDYITDPTYKAILNDKPFDDSEIDIETQF